MTLSITINKTTLRIVEFSIMTLCIMTLSIMLFGIKTLVVFAPDFSTNGLA